jgi:hypothetical protein
MPDARTLLKVAEELKDMMVARATGARETDDERFASLRQQLVAEPFLKQLIPECVRACRTGREFWLYIKPKFPSYAERASFLRDEFTPVLNRLEAGSLSPADAIPPGLLAGLTWDGVQSDWHRALERKAADPEGAITAARTLLETVCKHILDEAHAAYENDGDLPKLYKKAAAQLNLGPSQHTEQIFKQILSGCQSVVLGLGALRNQVGDAHGQGTRQVRPSARHAELAVNLAGAMATFLVETWVHRASTSPLK